MLYYRRITGINFAIIITCTADVYPLHLGEGELSIGDDLLQPRSVVTLEGHTATQPEEEEEEEVGR